MASLSTITNRVLPLFVAAAEDSTFSENALMAALGSRPECIKRVAGGGESLYVPVNFGRHSKATELITGADAYADLDSTVNLIEKKGSADWCEFYQPVRISESELNALESPGNDLAMDMLRERVNNVVNDVCDRISRSFLLGAAAPTDRRFTNLQSLNGVAATTGWLQNAAPTSQTNTVLGLSQTTYRGDGWFSQYQTAGGTLTEAFVGKILTGIRAQTGSNPDMALVSEEFFNALTALVDSKIHYQSMENLGFGFGGSREVPVYNGVALFLDARMGFDSDGSAAGTDKTDAYFLSSKHLRLHVASAANLKGVMDSARKKAGVERGPQILSISEFIRHSERPVYTATVSGKIQFTTSRLNAHGSLLNA